MSSDAPPTPSPPSGHGVRPPPRLPAGVMPRSAKPMPAPHFEARVQPLSERSWFKAIAGGVAIFAGFGTVADVLQPLAPFATYGLIASLCLLLAALWGYRRYPALRTDLGPLAAALAIVFVCAGGLKVAQAVSPGGGQRGLIASHSDAVRGVQGSLLGIEKSLEGLGEGLGRVERDVGLVGDSVGRVEQQTAAIDTTTRKIGTNVDALRQASDPASIAQQKIANAGYAIDDAGYIKAIAQGSEAAGYFKDLKISGDEASLREALLASDVSSNEFKNIGQFLRKVPSDHYGAKVRDELKSFVSGIRETGAIDPLRASSCSTLPASFAHQVMRKNLSPSCPDEMQWYEATVDAIKAVTQAIYGDEDAPDDVQMWLIGVYGSLVYHPKSPRQIKTTEFLALLQASTTPRKSEFLSTELLIQMDDVNIVSIFKSPAPVNSPTARLAMQPHPKFLAACGPHKPFEQQILSGGIVPECRAKMTLQVGKGGLKVLAINSAQPLR